MTDAVALLVLLAVMASAIVAANVWDRRRRSRMTPAERKRDDDRTNSDRQSM